jgi:hypothetical protein
MLVERNARSTCNYVAFSASKLAWLATQLINLTTELICSAACCVIDLAYDVAGVLRRYAEASFFRFSSET